MVLGHLWFTSGSTFGSPWVHPWFAVGATLVHPGFPLVHLCFNSGSPLLRLWVTFGSPWVQHWLTVGFTFGLPFDLRLSRLRVAWLTRQTAMVHPLRAWLLFFFLVGGAVFRPDAPPLTPVSRHGSHGEPAWCARGAIVFRMANRHG